MSGAVQLFDNGAAQVSELIQSSPADQRCIPEMGMEEGTTSPSVDGGGGQG